MKKLKHRITKHLHPQWRHIARRSWAFRASLVCGILDGAVLGLAVFADALNHWWFLGLNVAGYGAIALLRLIKQPGADL